MKCLLQTMLLPTFYLLVIFFPRLASSEIGYIEPWGKDSELLLKSTTIPKVPSKTSFPSRFVEQIILFHQNVLSKVDGPRSHFRPTSSRYMLLSIRRHGFFKGVTMGFDRLLRENREEWVYRTREIGGTLYKWDPTYKEREKRKKIGWKRRKPDPVPSH